MGDGLTIRLTGRVYVPRVAGLPDKGRSGIDGKSDFPWLAVPDFETRWCRLCGVRLAGRTDRRLVLACDSGARPGDQQRFQHTPGLHRLCDLIDCVRV